MVDLGLSLVIPSSFVCFFLEPEEWTALPPWGKHRGQSCSWLVLPIQTALGMGG
jgi:hypothetical protein